MKLKHLSVHSTPLKRPIGYLDFSVLDLYYWEGNVYAPEQLIFELTNSLFELGRQARPGRQTGIRLYRPVPADGQNKSWGHRLTAKAITYHRDI
jgi:hypothetical protein